MYTKYKCDFYSEQNDTKWSINIDKRTGGGSPDIFLCTSEGFVLSMDGKDDDLLAPIKTSSVTFNMVVPEGSSLESIFDDLNTAASENENEYIVTIYRYYDGAWRRYWFGVLLSDLAEIQDTSPNRIVKIKAVDGLTKLKYKQFNNTNTEGGERSMLNIIKLCLSQIPTTDDDFGLFNTGSADTETFLAHTPFYYSKGMDIGGTPNLDTTWRQNVNHDPLALCRVNMNIFQDREGKPWTYYKILEQVLACFQLRLMMTPIKNDSAVSGFGSKGDAVWLLQSPMVFHNDTDNAAYDGTQLMMLHNKDLDTDVALSYTTYSNDANLVNAARETGGLETFVAPLLSYRSIYSHNNFSSLATMLDNFNSVDHQNGTTLSFSKGGDVWEGLGIELTGQENIPPEGYTGAAQRIARQKLLITGEVIIYPIDLAYNQTGGLMGYSSCGEYYNEWYSAINSYYSGLGIYQVVESDFWVFPRFGLKLYTLSETIEADGSTGDFNQQAYYWLYNTQFLSLAGSVPWANKNGTAYTTDQHPDNYKGWDTSTEGVAFDMSLGTDPSTNSTIFSNDDGVQMWCEWWDSTSGWYRGEPDDYISDPVDNHWAYFSPFFYNDSLAVANFGTTFNNYGWTSDYLTDDYIVQPFSYVTPQLPWNRKHISEVDDNYGWSSISQIQLYYGFRRDQVIDSSGVAHYVCCKNWTINKNLTGKDRGVQWGYTLNNIKVYVLGVVAGLDSYDASYGVYENTNGSPSEEEVQSPEIIIGDEPAFNPYANDDDLEGFGGDYLGQLKLYNTADQEGVSNTGEYLSSWGTIHQLPSGTASEFMKLHKKRARLAMSHRFQIKRKLELKLVDTTTNRLVEMGLFGSLYRFASGSWEQNQSSVDIAYMPSGGQFVAGTGRISITMQDCVTYNKSNLTDTSYSSNG